MNSKIFPLFALTILSLVIFVGMASAATLAQWTLDSTNQGSATNVASNVVAGSFTNSSGIGSITHNVDGASASGWETATSLNSTDYFQITIAPSSGYNLSISDLDFITQSTSTGPMNYDFKWSKSSAFTISSVIETYALATNDTEYPRNLTSSISVAGGETLYLRWYAYNASAGTGDFYLKSLNVEGTATSTSTTTTPDEITECSTTGTTAGSLNDDLRLDIEDITIISGFGDDNEWLPIDEIEVEIKVENDNADYKIKNIEVEWGLYDRNKDRWYVDDKESDFSLKDGDEKTIFVTFKLDDDVDDLADGDYIFYVWANSYLDDNDLNVETDLCASDSQEIDMIIESDFVILDDISFPEIVECGDELRLTSDVWNIGDDDQQDVYVQIYNQALGINKKVIIGDVDAFDSAKLDVLLDIPSDVDSGKFYQIEIAVYNEDNEVFQNDYDDDESEFKASVKVEGGCTSGIASSISASLQSGGKAGEALVINSIITADSSGTYVIRAADYSSWATTDTSQLPIILTKNVPKEVTFTFNVNEDASGINTLNLELVSGTDVVLTQPVSVTIEGSSSAGLGGITGGFLGGNKYIWAIGFLNVILIVVIIVVAIKVAMK